MRICSIAVTNFKSLVDFDIDLAKFGCLIGLNGAGKSTVLQLIDFLGQQARGDLKGWLKERNWQPKDLGSRLTQKKNIEFNVVLEDELGCNAAHWEAVFNTTRLQCTFERIVTPQAVLEVEKRHLRITRTNHAPEHEPTSNGRIPFRYQGSVLSQLIDDDLPPSLLEFREFFKSVRSLDLLSPDLLRQRTRESADDLGLGGQRLAGFLHQMRPDHRKKLLREMQQAYQRLSLLQTTSLRTGIKQLEVFEQFGEKSLRTEARHINDGMLRLMAILAELETENQFLLFDEIENGINSEMVEFVIDKLVNAAKQILITTHSPMILNYLDDATARSGVIYLYKTDQGHTKSIPFFSIPSLAEKLTVMGPGEAFVDTDLSRLVEEISGMALEEA